MARDYAAQAPATVRRADRAVTDEPWLRATLHSAAWGTLATVHEGQPFLNSNLFVFDEARHALYLHTARVGRTQANVSAQDGGVSVCFGVFDMGRMLPADEALEFSVEYEGVTVFGTAHMVTDADEAEHGLQLLLDKYAPHLRPGRDYRGITAEEIKRTAVYRVDIESWVGKKKQAPDGFPGAFVYVPPPVSAPPAAP